MKTIVSFGLCPFVQRSLITMNYKSEPYEVKYIDLANKPDWFLKLSPLGKVPIMQIEDDVLFESAVINEYIDETTAGSLLPSEPLKKAKDRAMIEFSSALTMNYFQAATASDKNSYEEKKAALEKTLTHLLTQYQGPFFHGENFSLVDTSAIPALQRLTLTKNLKEDLNLDEQLLKKMDQWLKATLSMDAVKNSVPDNFESDYNEYLIKRNSYIHQK